MDRFSRGEVVARRLRAFRPGAWLASALFIAGLCLGAGIAQAQTGPVMEVDPESLPSVLVQGSTETRIVTIANTGDASLIWSVPDLSQFGANVRTMLLWDDGNGPALYVGGNNNSAFRGIARWDGQEWAMLGIGMNGSVDALAVFDGELVASGAFTQAGGVVVNRIARWNGQQWLPLDPAGGANSSVQALTVFKGELIAGGGFTQIGGQAINRVARWNGSTWAPLGAGMDGTVTSLTIYDGDLIAAGFFLEADAAPAIRIARWNGSGWSPLGAGLDGGIVSALALYDGDLIAAGRFTSAGGAAIERIARWDGDTWSPLSSGVPGSVTTNVSALAVYDGELIAGGLFSEVGGIGAANIARWDGSAWSPLSAGVSGQVSALALYGGELIVGGQFNFASSQPARGIAQWNGQWWSPVVMEATSCDLPEWLSVTPLSGTVPAGQARTLSVGLDAIELPIGEYAANLCLLGNDPQALLVEIPVDLTVTPAPEADVGADSFSFTLFQGAAAAETFSIANSGGADLDWHIGAIEGADLVAFDDVNFTPPANQFGGSVRWDTGETCNCQSLPHNFNVWRTASDGRMAFFWPGQEAAGGGGVSLDGGSRYALLGPGDAVGSNSTFIRLTATDATMEWRRATNVDGYMGFRFVNPSTQQVNFGYARITTTGITGHPATIVSWVYDQSGHPVAIGGCTDPADIPWLEITSQDGVTPPGEDVTVNVSVTTGALDPGIYEEQVCVVTNDPWLPLKALPVTLTVRGDEPAVEADPMAFEFTLAQGAGDDAVLNIGNSGVADLQWSFTESEPGRGGVFDVLEDGSFENGTPSPHWQEGSTNFGTPLCDASCGVNGALDGGWWAWFGGSDQGELGFLAQDVAIPPAESAQLRFWLQIDSAFAPGTFRVLFGDDELFSVTDADAADYVSYTEVVLDLLAYADGQTRELRFEGETLAQPQAITNFFVDQASLVVDVGGGCDSPTDIPWLSATPAAGTTAPGAGTPVDVAVTAAGLAPGSHQAQLCLASNDPMRPLLTIPVQLNVSEGGMLGNKLVAADGASADWFGRAVAIDGDTVLVAADAADIGGIANQGAVYVFVRQGDGWIQQAKLTADDGAQFHQFGISAALSGDTALIGGGSTHAAYVFVRNGGIWTQQARLVGTDTTSNDTFGIAVAIDGDTAVVGARTAMVGGNMNQGAAYVFVRSGQTWSQQAKLTAGDGLPFDLLGDAVAVSGDTVVAGAAFADPGGNDAQGAAYVFERSGTSWSERVKLLASDGAAGARFGVAVSLDGDTAVIGASLAAGNLGAAYVFSGSGGSWSEQARLSAADAPANATFGNAVAVDGDTALVGALFADSSQGAAYVFNRSGSAWTQGERLTAEDGAAGDQFGQAVALDGDTAVVSAWQAAVNGNSNQGAAYVFALEGGGTGALTADPDTIDFGTVPAGVTVGPATVTLSNTGDTTLTVTVLDAPVAPFERAGGDCAAPPFELAPDAGCTLAYRFGTTQVGTFEQVLTADSAGGSATITLRATAAALIPAQTVLLSGSDQSAVVGTAFAQPLAVQVLDAFNNPVPGIGVGFTAPANGPSAVLSAASAVTDGNGYAAVTAVANGETGSYVVTASGPGGPVQFDLSNIVASPDAAVGIVASREHVRPGQWLDYLVAVHNIGPHAATQVDVASLLSPLLDLPAAHWQCLGPATSGCTAAGQGDLADSGLNLPAQGSVMYALRAPVPLSGDEGGIETAADVSAPGDVNPDNDSASVQTVMVLFRDGFEPYGDGAAALPLEPVTDSLTASQALILVWPAPGEALVEPLLAAEAAIGGFRLERLNAGASSWARLVAVEAEGAERATAWQQVAPGAALMLALFDGEASGSEDERRGGVLLSGPGSDLRLPLVALPADWRLRAAVPLQAQAIAED